MRIDPELKSLFGAEGVQEGRVTLLVDPLYLMKLVSAHWWLREVGRAAARLDRPSLEGRSTLFTPSLVLPGLYAALISPARA